MVALVASLGSLAWAASSFPDVPASHPNYTAITDLADRGIISGKTDGKFYPSDQVTRQQFAKMIVGTGGYPVSEANICPFGDVTVSGPGDLYPDNYVAVCAAQGITLGKTETTFDPTGFITRYQVISMVVRTANDLAPGLLSAPPAGYGTWAGDLTHGANAARAEYNDLLAGLDLVSLNPLGNMTRGEVAQVLHNLLVKLGGGPGTTGGTYTLSVSAAGTGSGTVAKSPDLGAYNSGSTVLLTATAASGSVFMGWSGDASGSANPLSVTMDANKTIVATFNAGTVLYTLTASVPGGGGTITKSPNQTMYPSGTSVQLTAVPATGYSFHHWAGSATGTTNPVTVVMDSNKTVSAVFVPAITYTLTASVTPTGKGTVSKNPNKTAYNAGEQVTLTASPAAGYAFDYWSGSASGTSSSVTVTMNSNKTVTAHFKAVTYSLTVTVNPAGTGIVMRDKQAPYAAGTEVWLTANADSGYLFDHWSGDATGTSNPLKVTMTSNKTITAHYVRSYTIKVTAVPEGTGTITKTPNKSRYAEGTSVSLKANPAAGWVFDHWSRGLSGTANPLTVTVTEDKDALAWFHPIEYTLNVTIYPAGKGTVTKSPNQATYHYGDVVTLTAHPIAGWYLWHWGGSASGSANPLTVTINGNKTISATFNEP